MSIRLRQVPGVGLVALCAARSVEQRGDIYLDDAVHHALARKFADDFQAEGLMTSPHDATDAVAAAVAQQESNNPNRAWWDRTYGPGAPPA